MPLEAGRHAALVLNCTDPSSRLETRRSMNSSLTRSSRWLAPSMLAALLVLTGSAQAPANTQLPAGSVVPSERHRSVARKRRLDAREACTTAAPSSTTGLSAIVYTRYLESIDGQHSSLLATRHRGVRPVPAALRRHDPQRRRRSGLRDLRALPAAQPRAHQVRDRAARQGAGLDAQRDLRVRPREGALGQRPRPSSTSCGASA